MTHLFSMLRKFLPRDRELRSKKLENDKIRHAYSDLERVSLADTRVGEIDMGRAGDFTTKGEENETG